MTIMQSIKCSITNKQSLESIYSKLDENQLKSRKKSLKNQYLIPSAVWFTSAIVMYVALDMEVELLALYTLSMIGVLFSLYVDYKNRKKLLNKYLSRRETNEQDKYED